MYALLHARHIDLVLDEAHALRRAAHGPARRIRILRHGQQCTVDIAGGDVGNVGVIRQLRVAAGIVARHHHHKRAQVRLR